MRIYVASKFANAMKCAEIANTLKQFGHEITFEWWTEECDKRKDRVQIARDEVQGVKDAYAVVLLQPREGGCGCWIEVGIAIADGTPIYYLDENLGDMTPEFRTIFMEDPEIIFCRGVADLVRKLDGK